MKKHIAFYISSLRKGGAERVFVNLAEYFHHIGYRVTIVTQYKEDEEYKVSDGIERNISDISEAETTGSRIVNFSRRFAKLRTIWKQIHPDVILSCIGKNNFMALATTLGLKTAVAVSIVGEPTEEYNTPTMRLLAKTLFMMADGIVLQTSESRKFFPAYIQKKSVILQNSLNPAFMKKRFTGSRTKQIITVGRLDENKNQAMLLRAFAAIADRYRDYSVTVYGEGESRQKLEALIEELNLQGLADLPGLTTDVAGAIWKASIFVLTSNTEGMPNALIEAMALGLPVISTDCPCGGPKELIEDGKNGLLVPVGDSKALEKALIRLLDNNDYAEQLGRSAADIQKRLDPERTNRYWQEYLESLL